MYPNCMLESDSWPKNFRCDPETCKAQICEGPQIQDGPALLNRQTSAAGCASSTILPLQTTESGLNLVIPPTASRRKILLPAFCRKSICSCWTAGNGRSFHGPCN